MSSNDPFYGGERPAEQEAAPQQGHEPYGSGGQYPQQYGQQYGQQPAAGGGPYVQQESSGLAIASLISGILSWVLLPVIAAIIAVVLGWMARNEIRESNGRLSGDGMALAGLILGGAQLALTLIGVCLFIIFFFFLVAVGASA